MSEHTVAEKRGDKCGAVCCTFVFTLVDTASSIALAKIVDKSLAENTNGEMGIVFATAQAKDFNNRVEDSANSPAI